MRSDIINLSNNRLTGPVPSSLWGPSYGYRVVLIHNNEFVGHLPSSDKSISLALFTASNNRLSGILPHNLVMPSSNSSTALVGNAFSDPLPEWENAHRNDLFLYVSTAFPTEWQKPLLLLAVVIVECLLCLCFTQVKLWRQGIYSWWRQCWSGIHRRVCYGFIVLTSTTVLSTVVLLPVYALFGSFYEFGRPLSKLSVSYLDGYVGEYLIATTFVVYSVIVVACVVAHLRQGLGHAWVLEKSSALEGTRNAETLPPMSPPFCKRLLGMTVVAIVFFVCAIPSIIYAMMNSLPEDNIVTKNRVPRLGMFLSVVLSPFLFLCNNFIYPSVCYWSGKFEYPLHPSRAIHVGSRRLILVSTLSTLVLPIVVLVIWDGGCFGWFMNIWTACSDGSFDIKACVRSPLWFITCTTLKSPCATDPYSCPWTTALTSDSICTPSFRWGFCSRRIVEVWAPIMIQKFIIVSVVAISCVIINSPALKRAGRAIESCLPIDVLMTNSRRDISMRDAILVSQMESVIVWGVLSPLVGVAGWLAWTLRTMAEHYLSAAGLCDLGQQCKPVYWYMLMTPIMLCMIESWIFLENNFAGKELVWATSCIVTIVVGINWYMMWQRRKLSGVDGIALSSLNANKDGNSTISLTGDDYVLMGDDNEVE